MKTAMMGPFRKILGLSENLPVKIMTATVNMASSTPRLWRNMVASSSLSPYSDMSNGMARKP